MQAPQIMINLINKCCKKYFTIFLLGALINCVCLEMYKRISLPSLRSCWAWPGQESNPVCSVGRACSWYYCKKLPVQYYHM